MSPKSTSLKIINFFLDNILSYLYIERKYIETQYNEINYIMKIDGLEISNLAKNCNEALILAVLNDGRKHGYQIPLEIEKLSGGVMQLNLGSLYPILHKLEQAYLIKGTWEKQGPKRQRKYYELTEKGKEYFTFRRTEWMRFMRAFSAILKEDIP